MIDLTKRVVGLLTVLRFDYARSVPGRPQWICLCSCGNTKSFAGQLIRREIPYSCGCKRRLHGTNIKEKSHNDKLRWGASTAHIDRYLRMPWGKVRIDPREAA